MSSYKDHMGPVNNVQWSPFNSNLFISCSADWTVKLWRADRSAALLTFQTGTDEVHDVQWCPNSSTVFATATRGGSVEVWDFSHVALRPVASYQEPGTPMTCVLFNPHNETMIAGTSDGRVLVFRVFGVDRRHESTEAQQACLMEAMNANVMKTGARDANSIA
jgi:dynein intermediate chain 4, axonemal